MKKTHIIAITLILAAITVMVLVAGDFDTYSNFKSAKANPTKKVKINGNLSIDKPMIYDPIADANSFSFYMTDKKHGDESKVIYKGARPQDFERSEELVLTGYYENDAFIATDMLMKCPSKYKNEEIGLRDNILYD